MPSSRAPLRVALDATALLGVRTGVGVFCAGALAALGARDDVHVDAFAVSWRRRGRLHEALPPGVDAVGRPMPARPLHLAWRRFGFPPVEWFVGKADVVHGPNYIVPPTRRAARVVTVFDLTVLHHPELCAPGTLRFPELIRSAIADGAWVHTASEFVADEVRTAFAVSPERVRVVYGAPARVVNVSNGAGPPPPVTLPAGARRYVLAIGSAEPRKDLPGLVRAFDEVADTRPDVALVLAGPPAWGADSLSEALGSARHAERVVRTGYLADGDLDAVLAGAELLAYPSLYEGFGLPPLEAMAAGVPVVATAAGSVPEIVGDGALLSPPRDTVALATSMAMVLDDPEQRASLIARGRRRAADFSWAACGDGMTTLYRDAAADS